MGDSVVHRQRGGLINTYRYDSDGGFEQAYGTVGTGAIYAPVKPSA